MRLRTRISSSCCFFKLAKKPTIRETRLLAVALSSCIETPPLPGGNVHRSNRGETLKNSGLMARANNGANA
jgi:hypothetical protein